MAGLSLFNRRPAWMKGATALTTRWLESTLEVARWENMRRAGRRWGWWGAGVGAALGLIAYAPAPWLAKAVVSASDGRLLLADAQGTIWRGDAVAVLTGGPGSRDARALPGRLNWSMRLGWMGVSLVLQQDCCIQTPLVLQIQPAWSGAVLRVATQPLPDQPVQTAGEIGHWPAAWLGGLGTPWNTLQLQGQLALRTLGLGAEWASGRMLLAGQLQLDALAVSTRLSTLKPMGSYRLLLQGGSAPTLQLTTLDGALQMHGSGQWVGQRLRFEGEATAAPEREAALSNLLNIIGRRRGARSLITLG